MAVAGATTRTLVLKLAAALLALSAEQGQRPVAQPELLAGPWETTTPSGTHGFFLDIRTHARGPFDRQTITNQAITVRVYHRRNGQETWGWYGDNGSAASIFDGQRLRVVGLDATFHADTQRWSGTWSLDGEPRDVVLERPRPAPGAIPSQVCGDWEGLPSPRVSAISNRLHIVQSSDGVLTAWMDRVLDVIDQRAGEPLKTVSTDPNKVILELDSPVNRQYRFIGALSSDGSTLSGVWNGLNARDSFRRIR